jgi:hypothetical protein
VANDQEFASVSLSRIMMRIVQGVEVRIQISRRISVLRRQNDALEFYSEIGVLVG